jgi:hypothetical protein
MCGVTAGQNSQLIRLPNWDACTLRLDVGYDKERISVVLSGARRRNKDKRKSYAAMSKTITRMIQYH